MKKEDFGLIKTLNHQGALIKDIATEMGVHPRTVSRAIVSGILEFESSQSAGGVVPLHGGVMDTWICAEVAWSMPGLTRLQANELVGRLVERYKLEMVSKLNVKLFEEVYNIDKSEPTPEWQGIYDEVRGELIGMGIPLDRFG